MSRNSEIQAKYGTLVQELRSSMFPKMREMYKNDDILLRALLARKMDIASAQKLLIKYELARKDFPSLFKSATDAALDGIFVSGLTFHPNFLTPLGQRLFYLKALDWDPTRHPLEVLLQAAVIGLEYKSLDLALQEAGFILVIDAQDIGWKYVWASKPALVRAFGLLIIHYLPINVDKIIVINANWATDMIWKVVKPLLPAELVAKTIMCGTDSKNLGSFVSPDAADNLSFVPTDEAKLAYARDVLSHDHVVQSLRTQYMI